MALLRKFMKGSFFAGFIAACALLAAPFSSLAADTNATAQPGSHPAIPTVRAGQAPAITSTAAGGLFAVMTEQQRASYQEALKGLRPKFAELESQLRTARNDLSTRASRQNSTRA